MLLKQYNELKRKRTFNFQRRNYTRKVKMRHDSILQDFLLFCEGHVKSVFDIRWTNYKAYIRMLYSKRHLSPKTISKTYKHVLKMFFEDLNLPIKVRLTERRK